jgi:hypothetical protein
MTIWELDRWGSLRVAGLPLTLLNKLRMRRAPELWSRLRAVEAELDERRGRLVDAVYDEVSRGRVDGPDRRRLLALKRDLFNQRPLTSIPESAGLDPVLLQDLTALKSAEQECRDLEDAFNQAVSEEWSACQLAIGPWLDDERLLGGLILSNAELARRVVTVGRSEAAAMSKRQLRSLISVSMYLLRAVTRPTPFSTFGAVGLVSWDCASGVCLQPADNSLHSRRTRTSLNYGLLRRSVDAVAKRWGKAAVPVVATPWRVVDSDTLVFPGSDSTDQPTTSWYAVDSQDGAAVLNSLGGGSSIDDVVQRLSQRTDDTLGWRDRVDAMLEAGLLQLLPSAFGATADGVKAAADFVQHLTGERCALIEVVRHLGDYPAAPAERRLELLATVARLLGQAGSERGVLYEDVFLSAPTPPPLAGGELVNAVSPALHLIHSSLTDIPHMLMCEAFLSRYGLNGRCDDVPGFLTSLWRDGDVVASLRDNSSAPPWLKSPLVDGIDAATSFSMECDRSWFEKLPRSADQCAVSLLFQLSPGDGRLGSPHRYRIILNDVQSGRGKYLSRYLGNDDDLSRSALDDIRASLASESPLPLEVRATIDRNFQLHPTMCAHSLRVGDPAEPRNGAIELSDLSLAFDTGIRELVLTSRALGRRVEPLHLGFLRDGNLPAPILLLRALSPRYRDETVSERVAIYRVLDGRCVAAGEDLPPFRPRLTAGPLVLERARWAVPMHEVPMPEPRQPTSDHLRRIFAWLADRGLPDRCTAQVWQGTPDGRQVLSTPQYLDWHSPFALLVLRNLLPGRRQERGGGSGWLMLREALPLIQDSSVLVDGEPHAAEWMAQFRLRA